MKKILMTTSSLLLAGFFSLVTAQVPDFKNNPMSVNADGSLAKLEKVAGEKKSKSSGGMFGAAYAGASATMDYMVFPEPASSVQLPINAKFIIKVDSDVDPETTFKLTSVIVNKKNKNREVYTKKGGGKAVKDSYVAITFEKVSEGVYKIIPKDPLVAGTEYCFVSESSSTAFLFGTK